MAHQLKNTRHAAALLLSASLVLPLLGQTPLQGTASAQSDDNPPPAREKGHPHDSRNRDVRGGPHGQGRPDRAWDGVDQATAKRRLRALDTLRSKLPGERGKGLKVEMHRGLPKMLFSDEGPIGEPRRGRPDEVARGFLKENKGVFDLDPREIDALRLDREDPDGETTFLHLTQTVGGIKVYGGKMKVAVRETGEVEAVSAGDMLPGVSVDTTPTLSEEDAIARAFEYAGATEPVVALEAIELRTDPGGQAVYLNPIREGGMNVVTDLQILPMNDKSGRLAWRVYADAGSTNYFEVLVDAHTGEMLTRTHLVSDAHGTVYTASPTRTPTRTVQSFDGIANYGANSPWCEPEDGRTFGANAIAYVDTNADNTPDSLTGDGLQGGYAFSATQAYNFPDPVGNDPRLQKAASVTNLFYFVNLAHDYFYALGFRETSGNFQEYNFGRGGLENDQVRAEAQDGSGMNNANFWTSPDGQNPRMQMYLWNMGTSSTADDRDSSLDGDIVMHEYGHGVAGRIIGNSNGLGGVQSGALDEGWADYFAASYFNDGVVGEYCKNDTAKGLRRSAYAVPANTVNDSYADLGNSGFEVHDDGEIWCQTLWEIRQTLGAQVADTLIVRGMKYTASKPSFVNARDGILLAEQYGNNNFNRSILWSIFARHGLGRSAQGTDSTYFVAATDLNTGPQPIMPWVAYGDVRAGSLTTSDSLVGMRGSAYYNDKYQVRLDAGVPVTIRLISGAFDSYLYLKSSNGAFSTYNDDSDGTLNSRITFTPSFSDTYYIEATTFYAYATGAYTLRVEGDRPTYLACGATIGGTFTQADPWSIYRTAYYATPADHYTFPGHPGMVVTVDMRVTSGRLDCYLLLKSPSGAIVAQNDDGGGFPNSRMTVQLLESGTYTIEATLFDNYYSNGDSYTVSMTCSG